MMSEFGRFDILPAGVSTCEPRRVMQITLSHARSRRVTRKVMCRVARSHSRIDELRVTLRHAESMVTPQVQA